MIIEVRTSGLNEAQAFLQQLDRNMRDKRDLGLIRSVNRIADVWKDNYDREGNRVGGWAALADETQRKRARLGYGAQHPILRRDGVLRDVAVGAFTSARGPFAKSDFDGYGGDTTTSTLDLNDGVATLNAHGWKVSNQYRAGNHPPREMWFVDKTVRYAARAGLVDWLINDVIGAPTAP